MRKRDAEVLCAELGGILCMEVKPFIGITPDDDVFKELPKQTVRQQFNNRSFLTNGEICCGYGHFLILEYHLENFPNEDLLVFEDDIILQNRSKYLHHFLDKLKNKSPIILLGGQQGLKLELYFWVRSFFCWVKLSKLEKRHVYRTCCYHVSWHALEKLHSFRRENLNICVDDWSEISGQLSMQMSFVNLFAHPRNLTNSLLETERKSFKKSKSSFRSQR